jgi:L-fucose isomerase
MNHIITHPKIGIRPVIDGRRRGIRESLETQTMAMAMAVSALLSEELRYPDGTAVTCVVADTTIGGVAEAAACAEKFARSDVAASITVTPCWCYGGETIDMDPLIPKAIWGFNGTERPGAVYLAAALAGHNQKGIPAFAIYGRDVREANDKTIPPDVRDKLLSFARAALAVGQLRGKSYLGIGTVSMGIAGCLADERLFRDYLGMRNEYVDMSEVSRRLKLYLFDEEEYRHALLWSQKYCREGLDPNRPETRRTAEEKASDWSTVVKMTLIFRDLMVGNPRLRDGGHLEEACGHNAIAAGFQGQRHWSDWLPNGDFSEAILNSSYDWNGLRAPYIFATENDSLNAVSMLLTYLLTHTAPIFADVRTYWSPDAVKAATGWTPDGPAAAGFIHMINSGSATLDAAGCQKKNGLPAIKPFWAVDETEALAALESTAWCPANTDYFRGGGFSSRFETRAHMPMTAVRLNMVQGLGPVVQLAEGHSVVLPPPVSDTLWARTDYTWPSTWFAPIIGDGPAFRDVYTVMSNWGANHAAISYGHIGADLLSLCAMLRIPVSMHNVPAARLFRPSLWAQFGANDPTGADYRACQALGPIYGK